MTMMPFWKKGLGMGLGAGLVGAAVLAMRRKATMPQPSLPEVISPAIFARRVQRTTRGQIVYHVSGEGAPLVFLHDFFPGAASYEWSKVYPSFVGSHRVLAPDWIGFGESERHDRPLGAEDYAQSIFEFCRATCGGRSPVLVGSGVGASLACLTAAQHPEFAARLILLRPTGTASWLNEWVSAPLRTLAFTRRGRQWLYRNYLQPPTAITSWLEHRRSPGVILDLSEAVSVFASFARQYGAAWAMMRMMSGRFQVTSLPRLEEVCVPSAIWQTAPSVSETPRPGVTFGHFSDWGALAPLDRPQDVARRLRMELDDSLRLISV
jgi:pimeloyl-ACP methyl ester carboxylesterase